MLPSSPHASPCPKLPSTPPCGEVAVAFWEARKPVRRLAQMEIQSGNWDPPTLIPRLRTLPDQATPRPIGSIASLASDILRIYLKCRKARESAHFSKTIKTWFVRNNTRGEETAKIARWSNLWWDKSCPQDCVLCVQVLLRRAAHHCEITLAKSVSLRALVQ